MIPVTPGHETTPSKHAVGAHVVMLAVALACLAALAVAQNRAGGETERATDGFRALHTELRSHLIHLMAQVGQLPKQPPELVKGKMADIVAGFTDHIHAHAKVEEEVLYPVVDRAAGTVEPYNFTATMRYEHLIVGRWITELRNQMNQPSPDITAFVRRSDNLLGLVSAHFEEEEDILLPVLDAKMNAAQFKKEVMDRMIE